MRRIFGRLTAAATLTLGVTGCGLVNPPDALEITSAPPPAATSRPIGLGPALLLTPADLPPGYEPVPDGSAGPASLTQLGTGVQQCGEEAAVRGKTAQALFTRGPTGPFVAESIVAPEDGNAPAVIEAMAAAPARCPNITGQAPGMAAEVTVSLSQMTVPPLGDRSTGTQVVASVQGMPLTIRGTVIGFASRGLAVVVVVMGLGEVSKEEAVTVARAALARIAAVK